MRASADCIPCVLRQALNTARRVSDDPWYHRKVVLAVMEYLQTINFDRSPAEISFDCLRFANKFLGVADPFAADKEAQTARMLALEGQMRERIQESDDPLLTAVRYALAGNMIDMGIVTAEEADAALEEDARDLVLAVNDYPALRDALASARTVLYLLDNAGEVVCDKLVIELLEIPEVTCVVRAAPIINDVTREDVAGLDLGRFAKIVDVGTDALGAPLSLCSVEFRELFAASDVVIAKGQANFETLDEADREVFHVLRAKCEHLAAHFGVPRYSALVVRTPREGDGAAEPDAQTDE
ncbi:DUF89 family protein [bacterium]|nr:DUF89 family protein [bacterium]